ncbi:sterigmatocystin 8-O-methyltransferase [Annulohypoxylon stygium]|nr:sterigmatocystin 8-O-methyltransferase [Annulohypoxylon stygium]
MESSSTSPRIVELAGKISVSVSQLQELLSAQGVPSPAFTEDSPERLPANTLHLQDAVLDATAELHELLTEPVRLIFKFCATTNMVGIDAISRFGFADVVPIGGRVSFGEIAKATGLDEPLVRRLLRHAMARHIFYEPEPGMVAHTKMSKYFVEPSMKDFLGFGAREGWPAATRMLDAIQKWPSSEETNHTGFSLVNNSDKSAFELLAADHARAMRLQGGIDAHDHFAGWAATDVVELYDWASLGEAFVCQAGGQRGDVAAVLASRFRNLKFLIQDMDKVISGAEAEVPNDLKGRIEFKSYDLFEPQSVQADVYLLRLVFQIRNDKDALKILKAQVPALRTGAKVLILEIVMPEPGAIPLWRDREMRAIDLAIGASFNGRNRYLSEWKALLAAADARFHLQRVITPEGSLLSTLEIVWDAPSSTEG